jgi:hypothetical protein
MVMLNGSSPYRLPVKFDLHVLVPQQTTIWQTMGANDFNGPLFQGDDTEEAISLTL